MLPCCSCSKVPAKSLKAKYQFVLKQAKSSQCCKFTRCTAVSQMPLLQNLDMAKIGDWGMAKIMSEAYYTQDTGVGTFAWAAPEMLLGEK